MQKPTERGVTLIEMMVVVTIIALAVGISYPSLASGLESLRMRSATDEIVSFLNGGLNRAERRQQALEIVISRSQRSLEMRSNEAKSERKLVLPEGIGIDRVLPEQDGADANQPRSFLILPGGTIPHIALEISNSRGNRRIVRVDPITGTPIVEEPNQ